MSNQVILIIFLVLTNVVLILLTIRNHRAKSKKDIDTFFDEIDDFSEQDFNTFYKQRAIDMLFINFRNTKDELKEILDELRDLFDVEYVSIGLLSYYEIEDLVISVSTPNSNVLAKHKKLPKEKSFIYKKCIETIDQDGTYTWNFDQNGYFEASDLEDIGEKSKEAFNCYVNEIIPSKRIKNMLVNPIYDEDKNIFGYFHLINKEGKDFDKEDINDIKKISHKFSVSFESYINYQNQKKDDNEILNWYKITNTNTLINSVLTYFNNEFHLLYSNYQNKIKNGFSKSYNKVHITNCIPHNSLSVEKNKEIENYIELNRFYDFKNSHFERLHNSINSNSSMKINNLKSKEQKTNYSIYKSIFSTNNNLESLIELNFDYKIFNQVQFIDRVEYLVEHFKILLDKNTYNDTYLQINKLSEYLINNELDVLDDKYFDYICNFIKNSINAQTCSIFLNTSDDENLFLRATTAEFILDKDEGVKMDKSMIKLLIESQKPIYSISNPNSITSRVYNENTNVLIYNILSPEIQETNKSFMEETETEHKSLIAIPIKGNNKIIGVIRCINNNKTNQHIFEQRDLKILSLFTNIISNQIELNEFNKLRNNALSEFGHENKSPLDACYTNLRIFELDIKNLYKGKEVPNHFRDRLDYFRDNFKVIENNINNFSQVISEKNKIDNKLRLYEHDILKLIRDNIKVFKYTDNNFFMPVNENYKTLNISIDKASMSQVIYNLLSNADRYSDTNSTVIIELDDSNPNYFAINFINHGIGINEKDTDKIFELFYRSKLAKELTPAGSGIGLNVSRRIARKHNGDIIVSRLNSPTIITLLLPKKQPKK